MVPELLVLLLPLLIFFGMSPWLAHGSAVQTASGLLDVFSVSSSPCVHTEGDRTMVASVTVRGRSVYKSTSLLLRASFNQLMIVSVGAWSNPKRPRN